MNALIGDIGNTITKICLIETKNFKIKYMFYFESDKIFSEIYLEKKFKKIIKNKSINKIALFSSVVPKFQVKLERFLKKFYKVKLKEIKEREIKKIVKINLKNKYQVGSDRIANAAGVYKQYNSNCIVLDFGTATTFDVVVGNVYRGGVIAPGVNISLKTLIDKATLIPKLNLKKIRKVIGKNTVNAVRSGFFWGYVGLINNIIELIYKETKKSFKIIITGGFSGLFVNSLRFKVIIDKDITLKGLIKSVKLFNL